LISPKHQLPLNGIIRSPYALAILNHGLAVLPIDKISNVPARTLNHFARALAASRPYDIWLSLSRD